MLSYAQKQQAAEELREKFQRADGVLVADYRGLDVQSVNTLRRALRAEDKGHEYRVVKNTILRRAAAGLPVEVLSGHFQGPVAVALSYGDPIGLTKLLVNFAKDHEVFELKGGLLDDRAVDTGEMAALAALPGLSELRGQLIGLLLAPAQKLAVLLQAPGAQIARLAGARHEQLQKEGD